MTERRLTNLGRWRRLTCGCLILGAAASSGCHEIRRNPSDFWPADGEDVPILAHFSGAHSHDTRPMQFVVRNLAAWSQVQLRDVPVDFRKEMLLVVTLGRRSSDQYEVSIDRIWRRRGALQVEIGVRRPAADAPVVMSSPYCIAVVPRCDLNVAGFDPDPPYRERSWEQSPPPTDAW